MSQTNLSGAGTFENPEFNPYKQIHLVHGQNPATQQVPGIIPRTPHASDSPRPHSSSPTGSSKMTESAMDPLRESDDVIPTSAPPGFEFAQQTNPTVAKLQQDNANLLKRLAQMEKLIQRLPRSNDSTKDDNLQSPPKNNFQQDDTSSKSSGLSYASASPTNEQAKLPGGNPQGASTKQKNHTTGIQSGINKPGAVKGSGSSPFTAGPPNTQPLGANQQANARNSSHYHHQPQFQPQQPPAMQYGHMFGNPAPQFGQNPYYPMAFPTGPGFNPTGQGFQPAGMQHTQFPNPYYGAYSAQQQPPSIANAVTEAMLNSKELSLPKLTQDIAKDPSKFNQWVNKMIASILAHPKLKKCIATNPTGNQIFNNAMPPAHNHKLFLGLINCLDSVVHADVGIEKCDMLAQDGEKLYDRLVAKYSPKPKTFVGEEKIRKKYTQIRRPPTESIQAYLTRFKRTEQELRDNNLGHVLYTGRKKVYHIVKTINQKDLQQVALAIASGDQARWYKDDSVDAVGLLIEQHLEYTQDIDPTSSKKDSEKPADTKSKKDTKKGNGSVDGDKRKKKETRQTTLKETEPFAVKPNRPNRREPNARLEEFKIAFKQNPSKHTLSEFMKRTLPKQCYIHPGKYHPFHACNQVSEVCHAAGKQEMFKQFCAACKSPNQQPPVPTNIVANYTNAPVDVQSLHDQLANLSSQFAEFTKSVASEDAKVATELAINLDAVDGVFDDDTALTGDVTNSDNDTSNTSVKNYSEIVIPSNIIAYPNGILKAPNLLRTVRNQRDTKTTRITFHPGTNFTNAITKPLQGFMVPQDTCWPRNFEEEEHNIEEILNLADPLIYARSTQATHLFEKSITVLDSGATHNMNSNRDHFETIQPLVDRYGRKAFAVLGDGTTKCEIQGHGYARYKLNGIAVRRHELYVPSLNGHLTSVLNHSKYQGCYFHCENESATLAFPNTTIAANCEDEITMTITPLLSSDVIQFDEEVAPKCKKFEEKLSLTMYSANATTWMDEKDTLPISQKVQIKKIRDTARFPHRATPGSAGYDVYAPSKYVIEPNAIVKIPLGIAITPPPGMYTRIADRSSLASKGLVVRGGVIDRDYTGDIIVCFQNTGQETISIRAESRIAQLIFEKNGSPYIEPVDTLHPTTRGNGGFGSTNASRTQTFRISDDKLILTTKKGKYLHAKTILAPAIIDDDSVVTPSEPSEPEPAQQGGFTNDTRGVPPSPKPTTAPQSSVIPEHLEQTIHPIPDDSSNLEKANALKQRKSKLPRVDTVNNALPKVVTLSQDKIRLATGFTKSDRLIKHIRKVGKSTVQISRSKRNPSPHPGETASMRKVSSQKDPATPTDTFSEKWHMDIVYGPSTAIGGITHGLYCVERTTRTQMIFPLKNLKDSLLDGMRKFLRRCGRKPQKLYTDFDPKLITGDVARYLEDKEVEIVAAPPDRQDQNGLSEGNWETCVNMCRNWLRAQLLPAKFWWFGIKRAVEIQNILPIYINNQITTPHELLHGSKVDYRCLFPMFSTAYIRKPKITQGTETGAKWKTKSLKCIVVGTCPKSNGLLFYHPPTKQTITCGDRYKFDTFHPSGPAFNLEYDNKFSMNTRSDLDCIHRPPTHEENAKVYWKQENGKVVEAHVLSVPVDEDEERFVIQVVSTGDIVEATKDTLHDHDPTKPISDPPTNKPSDKPFPLIPWIHHEAKVTLFLPHLMQAPKQGYLQKHDETWTFKPGRKLNNKNEEMPLKDFDSLAQSLVNNKKLFPGWKHKSTVLTARIIRAKSNIIARHVSAKGLSSLHEPTLYKHHKLPVKDRAIWDRSYREEYDGLVNLDTWEVISEEEYKALLPVCGKALPTMAISTIKTDGEGNPERAKYRIVALGNLDPHNWDKSDCFAPVLSQAELRLLTALATRKGRKLKSCDVSQAFCQSYLPKNEVYVCTPPHGCPITPKGSLWRLRKTLYGLRRSPRHWYDKCKQILLDMGFKQCPNSPCLFTGVLIEGQPPIYLGVYVDDIAYYSESDEVEQAFETTFGQQVKTKFNGVIDYFLGIKFTYRDNEDGSLSVYLSQEAFIDNIVKQFKLDGAGVGTPRTPYRSGYPVDKVPIDGFDAQLTPAKINLLQSMVGCLTWLSTSTRPDVATITNMLAKYTTKASQGHINAAKRVIKYLRGTRTLGISFHSKDTSHLQSFVKFPISDTKLSAFTDANWGPQDQSKPKAGQPLEELDLFKSRSISGYIIWYGGPVHWVSKRQSITARSSAEAEIYATDECVKYLQYLIHILEDLDLKDSVTDGPVPLFNDNAACVCWSKSMTTKGLRHLQMRENAVREASLNQLIDIAHVSGIKNMSDLFTKEDKDAAHYIIVRDMMMKSAPPLIMR